MPAKSIRNERRLVKIAAISAKILAVCLLIVATLLVLNWIHSSPELARHFEIHQIEFEGIDHADADTLESQIRQISVNHLLSVDLQEIRLLVEYNPWIRTASVRRRLPDRLSIVVEERNPIATSAIEGDLFVVDADGVILDRFGPRFDFLDGPVIKGLRAPREESALWHNRRAVRIYLQVLEDFRSADLDYSQSISEIDVGSPENVAVIPTEEALPVILGDGDYLRRYQLFLSRLDLYRQLKSEHELIEAVDVSFENRIIFHTPGQRKREAKPPEGQRPS